MSAQRKAKQPRAEQGTSVEKRPRQTHDLAFSCLIAAYIFHKERAAIVNYNGATYFQTSCVCSHPTTYFQHTVNMKKHDCKEILN